MNILHQKLVEPAKILLMSVHLILGLMKNFVKAMDKKEPRFQYLKQKFHNITEAKFKEGIFMDLQINLLQ